MINRDHVFLWCITGWFVGCGIHVLITIGDVFGWWYLNEGQSNLVVNTVSLFTVFGLACFKVKD